MNFVDSRCDLDETQDFVIAAVFEYSKQLGALYRQRTAAWVASRQVEIAAVDRSSATAPFAAGKSGLMFSRPWPAAAGAEVGVGAQPVPCSTVGTPDRGMRSHAPSPAPPKAAGAPRVRRGGVVGRVSTEPPRMRG